MEKEYETDYTKSAGMVLKQDIDAKKMVDKGTTVIITINQLPEVKQGTVNIYIKEIMNYKPEKDENGVIVGPENVEIKILVDGVEQVKKEYPEDTEKVTETIRGIGNVKVEVYVAGNNEEYVIMDLNSNNTVLDVR